MGAVFGVPQPRFEIDVIGWSFEVMRDDPKNGFKKGEIVVPVSYRVFHGYSSQIAKEMVLKTQCGRSLSVKIKSIEDSNMKDDEFYFIAKDYPAYDACHYKSEGYHVTLQFTDRLRLVQP